MAQYYTILFIHLFRNDIKTKTGNRYVIWDTFLNGFSDNDRQNYNCDTCKGFVTRFGDLVYINPNTYELEPAVFAEYPYIIDEDGIGKFSTWETECPRYAKQMNDCYKLVKSYQNISEKFYFKSNQSKLDMLSGMTD